MPPITDPVLVVGAGGIGCELLKTLVQSGFLDITVIDLDTIDVSNLNRQFLFRKHHVGQSKAKIAAETVREFSLTPQLLKITAHHGNIKDAQFDKNFFKQFKLVLNALDNVSARQHVNRLCVACKLPMIDAGTTGFLGQANVMLAGETNCYDCEPRSENTQRFPICTIRSTPDKPVHCIVWAKELYKLLFGNERESDLVDFETSPGATTENEFQAQDFAAKSIVMNAVKRFKFKPTREQLLDYAQRIFDVMFCEEIKIKLEMRDGYKTAKKAPTPLSWNHALGLSNESLATAMPSQRIWAVPECAKKFQECICEAWMTRFEEIGSFVFDKDDVLAMEFVTAAANLRSYVFGIEQKSPFDVKGIAGNIIHAVATTNAIVAGLQVLEARRLLSRMAMRETLSEEAKANFKLTENSKYVWVLQFLSGSGYLLQPTNLDLPKAGCIACGTCVKSCTINCNSWTLGDFIQKVLKAKLGVNEPTILLNDSVIYEDGNNLDPEELANWAKNAAKIMAECPCGGIRDQTELTIDDYSQGDLNFRLVISHWEKSDVEVVDLQAARKRVALEESAAKENTVAEASGKRQKLEEEDDDVQLIEEGDDDVVEIVG